MSQVSRKIKSPVGELTLVADGEHLVAILWENEKPNRVKSLRPDQSANARLSKVSRALPEFDQVSENEIAASAPTVLDQGEAQLKEYFRGERNHFDLPLKFSGTAFQRKIWQTLQKIPFGETWSYTELAKTAGSPGACRAAGAANAKNLLSIVVPCHRVIGRNGKLTGFAGGLDTKNFLLKLESRR